MNYEHHMTPLELEEYGMWLKARDLHKRDQAHAVSQIRRLRCRIANRVARAIAKT